jgi:hypothetical protein
MKKVNMDVIKPWIAKKTFEYLKIEDEVLIELVYNLLPEQVRMLDSVSQSKGNTADLDRLPRKKYFFLHERAVELAG